MKAKNNAVHIIVGCIALIVGLITGSAMKNLSGFGIYLIPFALVALVMLGWQLHEMYVLDHAVEDPADTDVYLPGADGYYSAEYLDGFGAGYHAAYNNGLMDGFDLSADTFAGAKVSHINRGGDKKRRKDAVKQRNAG